MNVPKFIGLVLSQTGKGNKELLNLAQVGHLAETAEEAGNVAGKTAMRMNINDSYGNEFLGIVAEVKFTTSTPADRIELVPIEKPKK